MEDPGLSFFFEPVALATDIDDTRVMQQPVQQGGCQDLIGEQLTPFAERFVAGQDDGALFITFGYQLEQEGGDGAFQRQIAHLIEDEQLGLHNCCMRFAR